MMIDLIKFLFDFIMHIDEHLISIVQDFGYWTYGIMFLIVFVETIPTNKKSNANNPINK